jgi:glucokinase
MIPFKKNNYEYYCSGQYFMNEFKTTGEELFWRAVKGDPEALDIFSGFGANLGEAIKVIMYTIDPEIIVLGGSVSKSYNLFKDEMFRSINNFSYSKSINNLRIEVSEIDNVAILGAAALYYDDIRK